MGPVKRVFILGYSGFGSVGKIVEVCKKLGVTPVPVVNRGGFPEGAFGTDVQVEAIADVFDPDCVAHAIESKYGLEGAGLCSQFDLLTFVYRDLRERETWRDVPGPPPAGLVRCRIKSHFRELAAGLPLARIPYALLRVAEDVGPALRRLRFPCVLKPVAGAGSHLVRRCTTEEEVLDYVRRFPAEYAESNPGFSALRVRVDGEEFQLGRDILMEEEVAGPEVTVDGLMWKGRAVILHTQDMIHTTSTPSYLDVGFISPPVQVDAASLHRLEADLEAVLNEVGFQDALFHAEVKFTVDGPKIIELNPRFGGGPISIMAKMAADVDLVELFVRTSVGLPPAEGVLARPGRSFDCRERYFGYHTLFGDRPGRLRRYLGVDTLSESRTLAAPPIKVVAEGERIPSFLDKKYLMFTLFRGDAPHEVIASLREAATRLGFEMDDRPGES